MLDITDFKTENILDGMAKILEITKLILQMKKLAPTNAMKQELLIAAQCMARYTILASEYIGVDISHLKRPEGL